MPMLRQGIIQGPHRTEEGAKLLRAPSDCSDSKYNLQPDLYNCLLLLQSVLVIPRESVSQRAALQLLLDPGRIEDQGCSCSKS